jgi:glycosyltransferase involved in cell wall biosynthesis
LTVALVAHDVHDQGGMERAFAELIRGSADYVRYVVISGTLSPALRGSVKWRRVRMVTRPGPARIASFWLTAPPLLRAEKVDLVHTLGAIIPCPTDVATVQFCHAAYREVDERGVGKRRRPHRMLNYALYRRMALLSERYCYRPDRVGILTPVSAGVAREVARFYPGIDQQLTHNGVDSVRFRPDCHRRAEVRKSCGASEADIIALFVGGDWHRKGLELAIEGVAGARQRGAGVTLWVVGDGDRAHFAAIAENAGIGQYVLFLGPTSEPERFFSAADMFVFPTAYEAFSLVGLEAAASALPIIAPKVNGFEELLADGRGGIVIQRRCTDVADAIESLATDAALRAGLGAGARERALEYSWERSVNETMRAYENAMTRLRGRGREETMSRSGEEIPQGIERDGGLSDGG